MNYCRRLQIKSRQIVLALFFVFAAIPDGYCNDPSNWLIWHRDSLPDLPVTRGLAGAFAGLHNDVLIVAGGSYFDSAQREGGHKIYLDSIFVCLKEDHGYEWRFAGRLPYRVAHGASVSTSRGLFCVGGENSDGKLAEIICLRYDPDHRSVAIDRDFTSLPVEASHVSGAFLDGRLYIAGGHRKVGNEQAAMKTFLYWDPDRRGEGWKEGETWPGMPRFGAALVAQTNGDHPCLYLFGGKSGGTYLKDAYRFDPRQKTGQRWKAVAQLPRPAYVAPALPVGLSQVWIMSGSDGHDVDRLEVVGDSYRFVKDIMAYNTITNTWFEIGSLPVGLAATTALDWNGLIVIPGGEVRPGVRSPEVITASLRPADKSHFGVIDYITLFGYLGLIAWLGYYFATKNKDTKDFFLGGQKIPFWAAGLSMMAAQVSSIGFMAIPAKSFATDWAYFAGVFTWFIVVPLVIHAFVPFYRRLKVTSAYEYLEKRFNLFIRLFIATMYLLFQLLGRLGAIIFLPALALSAVTGMETITCILIIGLLATLYTALGGMHAVIWIDVIQALVLFGGIILCIVYILLKTEGGLGTFTEVAWNDHKFSMGSFDMNLTMAVFWVIIIGNIFNRLGTMATDQSVVQRYLTTRNEKETAKALWMDVGVSIPWALLVFGLGTALYVFYKLDPAKLDPSLSTDGIVPYFIGQNLPVGISGIIIAGIFAAAMSSVDSSIHSSTTVLMRDFFGRILENSPEYRKVRIAQWTVVILGALGTGIALVMTLFDITSVWDIILEIAGLFTGAMTGLFLLGIFTKRANGPGAAIGAVLSAILLLVVKQYTPLHFFLYSGIGIISSFTLGFLASLFFKSEKSLEGLTMYSVLKKEENG